jgi:hypothetical protein
VHHVGLYEVTRRVHSNLASPNNYLLEIKICFVKEKSEQVNMLV